MKLQLKTLIFFYLFLWTSNQTTAQNAMASHKDSLNALIMTNYDWNRKIFQADPALEDIDTIFQLFTNDFEYTHPKYGRTY